MREGRVGGRGNIGEGVMQHVLFINGTKITLADSPFSFYTSLTF